MPTGRFGGQPRFLRHPAQYVVVTFLTGSLVGAALLLLPVAAEPGRSTNPLTALFTATSAVCVTGLNVVDTASHWSTFGEVVILLLMQAGGLGIMTLSSLVVVALAGRLGLRQRLVAAATTGAVGIGDVRAILLGVVRVTVVVELTVAVALFLRFWTAHDEGFGRAAYLGAFHAVSSFNNAGFALFSDNLVGFANDPVLLLTISAAVIIGGLGFPVWLQIAREPFHFRRWDLHAKLTVATTAVLLAVGTVAIAWFEWTNRATLGAFGAFDSVVNGFFHGVASRTAGFNSIDISALHEPTRLVTEILMFIGGGSGSTAGGIKVTTFALLGFVIWAELRGDPDVVVFERRVSVAAHRQALALALVALGVVVASTIVLLRLASHLPAADLRFETVSALGTVGLSAGVTPLLSGSSQLLIVGLMLLGRVGPTTLFAAFVLREHDRLYRHPEERPLLG